MEFSKWLIKIEVAGPTDGKMFQNDKRYAQRGARSKYVTNDDDEACQGSSDNFDADRLFGMMKKKMRKGTK